MTKRVLAILAGALGSVLWAGVAYANPINEALCLLPHWPEC